MEFQVNRLNKNTFDIFEGKQWGSWTRLRGGKNGVYIADGLKLPRPLVRAVAGKINPKLPTQLVKVDNV